ncbi:hypothetical protein QQ73_12450, partial [Candidatus Endoriftia persephone str. Guaymas]|nr:hypothetical protein [Candidatus Endoriftia persephone str. Guaymas]
DLAPLFLLQFCIANHDIGSVVENSASIGKPCMGSQITVFHLYADVDLAGYTPPVKNLLLGQGSAQTVHWPEMISRCDLAYPDKAPYIRK